jgi:hypothetical protein
MHEITFPPLDAGLKDAAAIEIKLAPGQVRTGQVSGSLTGNTQTKKGLCRIFACR